MADSLLPLLFIIYFGLSFCALLVKPSPFRPLIFLPIVGIAFCLIQNATTGFPIYDYLLGNLICGNIFASIDFILLTDVQNELRLVGQTDVISAAPLVERLTWACKLFTSVRGIGWTHQPTYALSKLKINISYRAFAIVQVLRLMGYVCVLYTIENYQRITGASYVPKTYSGTTQSLLQALQLPILACLIAYINISMSYTFISALAVGTKISDPKDWPPLFGALSDAYTVRQCWGRTWHQLLRRMVSSHGKHLAYNILHLAKGSMASSYVQLYTAFFISGVIHHTGDYMMSHRWQGRSLHFFLLQAVAITIEDGVIGFGRMLGIRTSGLWKVLGFVWCWLWFAFSLPLWLTPIFEAAGIKN